MSRLLTILVVTSASLFGCSPTTGGTGGTAPLLAADPERSPQVIIVREVLADGGAPRPEDAADTPPAGKAASATEDGGTGATSAEPDASVTVTLDPDAAPHPLADSDGNCIATVNGSTVPWACDDICDGSPCGHPPPPYTPPIPSASDATPDSWHTYEGNCYDVNECPTAVNPLEDPARVFSGVTAPDCTASLKAAQVCTGPCTRLFALCANMESSEDCDPLLALDPVTFGGWCSRELADLGG